MELSMGQPACPESQVGLLCYAGWGLCVYPLSLLKGVKRPLSQEKKEKKKSGLQIYSALEDPKRFSSQYEGWFTLAYKGTLQAFLFHSLAELYRQKNNKEIRERWANIYFFFIIPFDLSVKGTVNIFFKQTQLAKHQMMWTRVCWPPRELLAPGAVLLASGKLSSSRSFKLLLLALGH